MPKTYYANTPYGFVKRTSNADYKNWVMLITFIRDGYYMVEISFHKQGNIKKKPLDAIYYNTGKVSCEPAIGLTELKKQKEGSVYGWITLTNL